MTDGAPSPVYLSSIAFATGERLSLEALEERDGAALAGRRDLLHEQGLRHARVSGLPLPELAAASARRTLEAAAGPAVGAAVYCTDTPADTSATVDLWDFLAAVSRDDLPAVVVGGSGCGNLGPGIAAARNSVLVDGVPAALLVTVDRVKDGPRFLPGGTTVLSDGAASCLISAEPVGQGPAFRIRSLATGFQLDVEASASPLAVARATTKAVGRTVRGALAPLGLAPRDVRSVVTGNYGDTSRSFLAMAAGVDPRRALCPRLADIGHCFSADVLITLADLSERDAPPPGEPLLLLTSSARSWSAIVVEYVAPR
ncbi:hypothetical protein [Streptomyces sp. URMC 123]|uniref:hypothetical protein n=1 Tax=Streptomyces sp. URMC 123 TaxID=3423403 RepID=UPI003F1B2FD3